MNIAIVKLSALGDIVHAMVALQFIKQRFPDMTIDWLVEQRFSDVLQYNPDINRILTIDLKALKQGKTNLFVELGKLQAYRQNHYQLVIDAQGLIKSAVSARLLAANTVGFNRYSIREKVASLLYKTTIGYPYDGNTIDRNAAVIGRPLGIEISRQQILNKAPFLFYPAIDYPLRHYFASDKPNILWVIGSTWPSRNYPKEKFSRIIQALKANHLIIWGNESEKQTAQWIVSQTDHTTLLPKLDFNQLKAAIAHADLIIGNDTGPTHMAWGLNKPSITLFGPTPISRVYQTPINKVLKSPSIVNPLKLNKNDFSIRDIPEVDIINLAHSLI